MDVFEAISGRRTVRIFLEKAVGFELLEKCVDAARIAPSAKNKQELDFIAVNNPETVEKINAAAFFGGVVYEKGRVKGEEPKAFIVIVSNKERASEDYTLTNAGIAANTIALEAFELGLGTCIMGAIERDKIREILSVPNGFDIPLAIAIGYPKEKPVMEEAKEGNLRYWIDENSEIHIPKRALKEVLHKDRF